jgi:DNA polymerase-3 subunit gamma/tau
MSYLVLARKWRPRDFSETVGQEHVLQALTNALESKRRFVDLIEVDAASKTKVDDTRELLDNVQYAPARGRYKVYLIDEVHMLSKSSFNALLKTLEEPPPHVKFLLATTDPQKLPVTVLSRCLQFNLKRLTPNLIRDRLVHICEAEEIKAETPALAMLARAADGSLRDALSLLDQAIAYCGGDVVEEAVGVMLGTIDRQHVAALLKLLSAGDAQGLLGAVAEIDEQFPDYARLLDDLSRSLQRIAVYQVVGTTNSEDELTQEELAELSKQIAPEDVQLFYQTAVLGRRDLHLAPDPRSGAEMTLLRMLAFQPPRAANRRKSDRPAQQPESVASDRPESKAAAPRVVKVALHAVADKSSWQDPDWGVLINELDLRGANKLLASNCAYLHRAKNTLYFSLDGRSQSLLTKSRRKALAAAVSGHFGEELRVEINIAASAPETPMQEEARRVDEKMEAARASLESDPNVKAMQDMFGAQLNPESIELVKPIPGESSDGQPASSE